MITERYVNNTNKTFCLQLLTALNTCTDIIQQIILMLRSSQSIRAWVIFSQKYQILAYTTNPVQIKLNSQNNALLPYFIVVTLIVILATLQIHMCCIILILKIKSDVDYIIKLCLKKLAKTKSWSANILLFILLYNNLDGG